MANESTKTTQISVWMAQHNERTRLHDLSCTPTNLRVHKSCQPCLFIVLSHPHTCLCGFCRFVCHSFQHSLKKQESMVAQAAKKVPRLPGTRISNRYIQAHAYSWQAHLKKISTYLQYGEGVWWKKETNVFLFHDADKDPDTRPEGPKLLHFCSSSMKMTAERQDTAWRKVLATKTSLPTVFIRLFDDSGMCTGRHYFHGFSSQPQCSRELQPHQPVFKRAQPSASVFKRAPPSA